MIALKSSKAFLIGILLFNLPGCVSLPRVDEWITGKPAGSSLPKIVSTYRHLSTEERKSIVDRLEAQVGPTDILRRHITVMEEISGLPLIAGNKATLLVDGPATYAAMFEAVRNARDHVNIETYIFGDDEVGRRFADLLLRKRSEGVQVHLIYDSIGSRNTDRSFFEVLKEGGIQVLEFNPINPFEGGGLWAPVNRDHRRILVVDGSVAFTGGVNFSAVYSKSSFGRRLKKDKEKSWRDTHVRIDGPVVAEFQKPFFDTWEKQKGSPVPPRRYFPVLEERGQDLVRVIASSPREKNRLTYLMYLSAVTFAQKFIHLTNAYFAPDGQMVKALKEAAQRGVDVRIILPSTSDINLVHYAGRSFYTELLESGVRIFEHRAGMLHAKTAIVDGVWSTIGSTNLDFWSFLRNDEINAVVVGADFANQMESLFSRDLNESDEVFLEQWKKRPTSKKVIEWISRVLRYWL